MTVQKTARIILLHGFREAEQGLPLLGPEQRDLSSPAGHSSPLVHLDSPNLGNNQLSQKAQCKHTNTG